MSIAVVILNWNGLELLKTYLPSVVGYSQDAQVYVLDNASTDDSLAYINKEFPQVKCIKNKQNRGYAGGYNEGLQQVKEDIFILLNNDVEVTENWLIPIIKCFETQKEVAVIQPKILDYKSREYFEYAGAAGGFLDFCGYPFCRGRIFMTLEKDEGQYDEDTEIQWASGACLAIRKVAFKNVNGFDETYFAHQEEIDLCWRIHNKGQKIWYCHDSSVYHLGGGTLNTLNPRKTFLNFRNSLFNILKNVCFPIYIFVLIKRLILDGVACVRFLFLGQFKHILAVLHAHFSFYFYFFKVFKSREKQPQKKEYYKTWSIVFQYFILGKKYFKDLS